SGPPAPSGSTVASAAALDSALVDPDLLSRCHNTDAWLLSTVETSRSQTVKVLRVLTPVASVEPDDPAIPRVVFGSERVSELGWCAPVVGPDRSPGVTSVQAWSVVAGRARRLALREDVPADGSPFGMLYPPPQEVSTDRPRGRPARGGPPATPSWQGGVYVFSVRDAAGAVRTFAIDLEIIPLRGLAAPASSPSPASRP
ncbi:MAG: hypothetical protein M3P84_07850, partial [Chloroflexota bacterium]|nr:hypothetical protein [Chloroflexota bacterium]